MNNATVCTKIVVTNLVDYSYTAELIETIALLLLLILWLILLLLILLFDRTKRMMFRTRLLSS